MSSTAEDLIRRHRYTVEDHCRMAEVGILAPDARVELSDGEAIEMPPIGAPYASVVTDIQDLLIVTVGDRTIVRVQNPIRLGRHSELQPSTWTFPACCSGRGAAPACPTATFGVAGKARVGLKSDLQL